jgi:hypothetical protein
MKMWGGSEFTAVKSAWAAILGLALATIALAGFPAPARSAEIRFERNELLGSVVLALNGPIARGDLFKTIEALNDPRAKPGLLMILNSPGGNQNEGLLIGYQLRRKGVGTVVPPGAWCASACALIFFGGVDQNGSPRKIAFRGSAIGVHRPTPSSPMNFVQAQRLHDGLIRYLGEVGVSNDIREKLFATEPAALYVLNETELVANGAILRGEAPKLPARTGLIRGVPSGSQAIDQRIRAPRPTRPVAPRNPARRDLTRRICDRSLRNGSSRGGR